MNKCEWKVGDIVRYGYGSTSLAQLLSPHAGGWHARHCLGGTTFVHDAGWGERQLGEPTAEDMEMWNKNAGWRGEKPQQPASADVEREAREFPELVEEGLDCQVT